MPEIGRLLFFAMQKHSKAVYDGRPFNLSAWAETAHMRKNFMQNSVPEKFHLTRNRLPDYTISTVM